MKVGDRHYRTIWLSDDGRSVEIIDQRWLPHEFRVETVGTRRRGIATAIRDMWVRGAPLIGVTAAYGVASRMRDDPSDAALDARLATRLHATRPTAINLRWALDEMRAAPAAAAARRRAPRPPTRAPPRSADEDVGAATARSASTASRSSAASPRASSRASRSTSSPTATPAGSRPSTRARRPRRSTCAARGRHPGPRLGRRDAAAQPGRPAHRLGAGRPRRAAHADRRQCRRPPDAARRGRHGDRRHRPHHAPTATSATRSAPTSRRSPRTTTACRSTSRCRRRRSTGRVRDGLRRDPDRGALRRRGHRCVWGKTDGGEHRPGAHLARGDAGGQPGLRRDAGPPGHRPDHRARHLRTPPPRASPPCSRSARAPDLQPLIRSPVD